MLMNEWIDYSTGWSQCATIDFRHYYARIVGNSDGHFCVKGKINFFSFQLNLVIPQSPRQSRQFLRWRDSVPLALSAPEDTTVHFSILRWSTRVLYLYGGESVPYGNVLRIILLVDWLVGWTVITSLFIRSHRAPRALILIVKLLS